MESASRKTLAIMLVLTVMAALAALFLTIMLSTNSGFGITIYLLIALLAAISISCIFMIVVISKAASDRKIEGELNEKSDAGDAAEPVNNKRTYISPGGKNTYENILYQHRRSVRNDYISSMLKGFFAQSESLKAQLERFGGSFDLNGFFLLSYAVHDLRDALLVGSDVVKPEEAGPIQYGVINIIDELINGITTGMVINLDTRIICIAEITDKLGKDDEAREKIMDFAGMSAEKIKDALALPCSVYISCEHDAVTGLANAYAEVVHIEEYCELLGIEPQTISYEEIDSVSTQPLSGRWAFEMERRFISAIQSGDYKSAKKFLNEVIERELSSNQPSIHVAKLRVFSMINLVMNSIDVANSFVDVDFFDREIRNITLVNSLTLPEFTKKMNRIFDSIIEHMEAKDKEAIPDWVVKISEYVNKHHMDPNLNVARVADEFGLNAAYASRTFKNYVSKGIFDYIQEMRLTHAKKLLLEGESAVKASEKSGFSNQRSMTRAFIKCEGTTPGHFAALSQKD